MRLGSPAPEEEVDERLHRAVSAGDPQAVESLLASGASVNVVDHVGHTPLHIAAAKNRVDLVKRLVGAGADVDGQASDEGWQDDTPLGHVVGNCTFEIAALLVRLGADPRTPGWMGNTPLDRVRERGGPEGKRIEDLFLKELARGNKRRDA
jgi:hypothetical protein